MFEVKTSVIHPMIRPDQIPQATQEKHYQGVIVIAVLAESVKVDGRTLRVTGMRTRVMRTVEIMSCCLRVPSMFFKVTVENAVAKNVVTKETRIPAEVIMRG